MLKMKKFRQQKTRKSLHHLNLNSPHHRKQQLKSSYSTKIKQKQQKESARLYQSHHIKRKIPNSSKSFYHKNQPLSQQVNCFTQLFGGKQSSYYIQTKNDDSRLYQSRMSFKSKAKYFKSCNTSKLTSFNSSLRNSFRAMDDNFPDILSQGNVQS